QAEGELLDRAQVSGRARDYEATASGDPDAVERHREGNARLPRPSRHRPAHENKTGEQGHHEHDHFDQTGSVERRGIFASGGFPGTEDPEREGHVGRRAGAFGETVSSNTRTARDSAFHSRFRITASS